jgi:tRNA(fMet)-specific endonuclease VapC
MMPRFMLDTNICIYLMKNQPEQVARRFAECYLGDVVISAVTFAELEFGVEVSSDPERERRNLDALIEDIPVVPFDQLAARAYGPVRVVSRDRKRDQLDKMIVAHAIALNVILVTNNQKDFTIYPTLRTENWLET